MKYLALIALLSMAALSAQKAAADTTLNLEPVTSGFQGDGDKWQCGIHSSHRVLKTYGRGADFREMVSRIGQQKFVYNVAHTVTKPVKEKVCKNLGLLKHICNEVVKLVDETTTYEIPLKLGIGRATHQLKDALVRNYNIPAVAAEKKSLNDIRALLDQGKPVIILLQEGVDGPHDDNLGGIRYPLLHWQVVYGWLGDSFLLYNTDSNDVETWTSDELFQAWDWGKDGYNKKSAIHAHLTRNEGLEVRSYIYLDYPIPEFFVRSAYQRIYGRDPNNSELAGGITSIKSNNFGPDDFLYKDLVNRNIQTIFSNLYKRSPTAIELATSQNLANQGYQYARLFEYWKGIVIQEVYSQVYGHAPDARSSAELSLYLDNHSKEDLLTELTLRHQASILIPILSILL